MSLGKAVSTAVRRLEEGMILASPIYSLSDTKVFDTGHRLSAKDIQQLKEWGFTAVEVRAGDDSDRTLLAS